MKVEDLYRDEFQEDRPLTVSDPDWLKLEIDLKKREFYKLSFFHFNVYYASAIILSLISTTWMLILAYQHIANKSHIQEMGTLKHVHDHVSDSRIADELQTESIVMDSLDRSQIQESAPVTIGTHEKPQQLVVQNDLEVESEGTEGPVIQMIEEKGDTLHSVEEPIVLPQDSLKKVIDEIEPIVIHKRDTIYEVDSIKVSRHKLRKLKN